MKTPFFYNLYYLIDKKEEEEEARYLEENPDVAWHYEQEALAEEENEKERLNAMSSAEKRRLAARQRFYEKNAPSKENAIKMESIDDNYCKESNMQEMVLEKVFPGKEWVHNKTIPGAPRRTRPDFRCEELKLIVEYNGHRHYTQAMTIMADVEKRAMYEEMGYSVIDWPYWLQPDKDTVKTYFGAFGGKWNQHFCDYHQGFVAKNCVLPADFCALGVERYNYELSQQDPHTIIRVAWSLDNKERLYGHNVVRCGGSSLLGDDDYYIDDTKSWWRKVHSYSYDEVIRIGSKIL